MIGFAPDAFQESDGELNRLFERIWIAHRAISHFKRAWRKREHRKFFGKSLDLAFEFLFSSTAKRNSP